MKEFLGKDFLLDTDTSRWLYGEFADIRKIPVIDYHCHLDPKEIYEDKRYDNIAGLWLKGDHYKWRQMRTYGIDEKYVTGDAPDVEKFKKWAKIMPLLIGNPLYIWSHMELKYYFGYEGYLNEDTADEVWDLCSEKLKSEKYSARNLIRSSNVRLICTTDDPTDSLIWHEKIAEDESFDVIVLPAWRPDKITGIEKKGFKDYIKKLSEVSGVKITDLESLKDATIKRLDFFCAHGCVISDHGLENIIYYPADEKQAEQVLKKALAGDDISSKEAELYRSYMLLFLGKEYNRRNWVMQLHYGCKRDNNTAMFEKLGPDTGFDCINDNTSSYMLAEFLNALFEGGNLPKTIVYSLNPNDNAAIGTVIGCFQGGGIRSRIQQGSAWWFNDSYRGMQDQIVFLSNLSMLGNFVGMLTDSRSFLSYTRHDYFRRILCRTVGEWVENGEYPRDEKNLERIIKGISYNNAVEYFGFELEKI